MSNKLAETLQAFENALSQVKLTVAEAAHILRALDSHRAAIAEVTKSEPTQPKEDE